jgi:hypothetical protein
MGFGIGIGLDILPRIDSPVFWRPAAEPDFQRWTFMATGRLGDWATGRLNDVNVNVDVVYRPTSLAFVDAVEPAQREKP